MTHDPQKMAQGFCDVFRTAEVVEVTAGGCSRVQTAPRMTESELDELLTLRWPTVVRRVMEDGSDEWLSGFVRSIAKNGKRKSWQPTAKQASIMRRLVAELCTAPEPHVDLFER